MPRYCPQELFLRECRDFKASLQIQASELESAPKPLSRRVVGDLAREMNRAFTQVDTIVRLANNMVKKDPGSTVIARNPNFWAKNSSGENARFENFFYSIQQTIHTVLNLADQGAHLNEDGIIRDLQGIASTLETNLRL